MFLIPDDDTFAILIFMYVCAPFFLTISFAATFFAFWTSGQS